MWRWKNHNYHWHIVVSNEGYFWRIIFYNYFLAIYYLLGPSSTTVKASRIQRIFLVENWLIFGVLWKKLYKKLCFFNLFFFSPAIIGDFCQITTKLEKKKNERGGGGLAREKHLLYSPFLGLYPRSIGSHGTIDGPCQLAMVLVWTNPVIKGSVYVFFI
jgi:hypothetical protein